MKSLQLFRTNSGTFNPTHNPQRLPSSPRTSSSFSVRRSLSESDIRFVRWELNAAGGKFAPKSFSVHKIHEESEGLAGLSGGDGGGTNKHDGVVGNYGGGDHRDRHGLYEMGDYYTEMIKTDPMNPLLLGNYAKYLHKVEKDYGKAEEYYSRAILASPGGDGQLLSLYGTLIWETQRDHSRASVYFQQAIKASPKDSMVLGSYANFLWEAEDSEDDVDQEMEKDGNNVKVVEVF